jgi:hypothetical protein
MEKAHIMKLYILQGIRDGFSTDTLGVFTDLQVLTTACRDHQTALQAAGAVPMLPRYQEYRYVEVTANRAAGVHMAHTVVL